MSPIEDNEGYRQSASCYIIANFMLLSPPKSDAQLKREMEFKFVSKWANSEKGTRLDNLHRSRILQGSLVRRQRIPFQSRGSRSLTKVPYPPLVGLGETNQTKFASRPVPKGHI